MWLFLSSSETKVTKCKNVLRAGVHKKHLMLIFLNVSFNYFQPAWNILTFVERHNAFQFVRSKTNVSFGLCLTFYVYPWAVEQLPGIHIPCSSSFFHVLGPHSKLCCLQWWNISASVNITVHCFCQKAGKKKKWGKIVSCGKCYFYRTAFSTEMPQLQKTSSQLYLKHIPGVLFTTYECQLLTFIPNDLDYKKKLFRISVQIKLIEIPCTRYVDQNVAIVTEIHQHY